MNILARIKPRTDDQSGAIPKKTLTIVRRKKKPLNYWQKLYSKIVVNNANQDRKVDRKVDRKRYRKRNS